MRASTAEIYDKTINVIQSCHTLKQLDVAINFANQATATMRKQRVHKNLLENLEDNIAYHIQSMGIDLYNKNKRRLLNGHGIDQGICAA